MKKNLPNIAVITLPFNNIAGEIILKNFIEIIVPLSKEIFAITGNIPDSPHEKVHIIRVKTIERSESRLWRIFYFIITQLRICSSLFKISNNFDIVIFYIGAKTYFIPMFLAKLLNRKVVTVATESPSQQSKYTSRGKSFITRKAIPYIIEKLEMMNYALSDRILVKMENVISFLGLSKFRNKIVILNDQFINTNVFRLKINIIQRRNLIGYVGRLAEEKGIVNFVKSTTLLSKRNDNLEFIVVGGGSLLDEMKKELKKVKMYNKVTFVGWIAHERLPDYLNNLKLLVVPSYTESGPNIALEAMACGTPVLGSMVGFLPDIIKDGENGFLMENNSPECIAMNVERVFEYPNLDEIVKRAQKTVERFTYEVIVGTYKAFLKDLVTNG